MTENAGFFLALSAVGLGFSIKVISDSLREISIHKEKIYAYQNSTRDCQEKIQAENVKLQEIEKEVAELREVISKLTESESEKQNRVLALKGESGSKRNFKLDT